MLMITVLCLFIPLLVHITLWT